MTGLGIDQDEFIKVFVNALGNSTVIQKLQNAVCGQLQTEVAYLRDIIKSKDDRISVLENKVENLENKLDDMEQYSRRNSIRISGIEETSSEDGFSETWLQENNFNMYNMNGYQCEHEFRKDRKGGGVSLYIKNHMQYNSRMDLNKFNNNIESLFVEICKEQTGLAKNVIVGVVYRPPNTDLEMFINYMSEILTVVKSENKLMYLMGDYNVNLLNIDNHLLTSEFLEMFYSYSFLPVINKPTRVTCNSATLIDNIYCNNFGNDNLFCGILYTDLTDHFPIFCLCSSNNIQPKETITKKRIYSERNINKFCDRLQNSDWSDIILSNNCQDSFTKFYNQYKDLYNECFPVRNYKISKYRCRKPWLTNGLKQCIKIKNKLYVTSIKFPTIYNISKYKEYRNKLHSLLRRVERQHYNDILYQNKNNLCKQWRVINEVINKKKYSGISDKFIINNKRISDKTIIANTFNNFFVNLGPNLAKNIPLIDTDPTKFITHEISQSLFLLPVSENELNNVIKSLNNSSPGADDITPRIVKRTWHLCSEPLLYILNLSFIQGVFPNELKVAKVIPLYKSNNKMEINNYRPVSILPAFSKIFERLMYNRLNSFINKHKILCNNQFGFRKQHDTNMALIIMVDKILKAMNEGEFVIGLFLDLCKAFDTLNHDILLKKLYKYGIRGNSYLWFNSYLSNRKQYVNYNGTTSSVSNIICGVPQGSILGPLLFIIYVNDIINVSNIFFPILFADDTNVFVSGKNINKTVSNLNSELKKLVQWLNINKLSLNIRKTHYIVFTHKKQINLNNNILINNQIVSRVESTKFLGVIIDSALTWKDHINYIKTKIAKGTGIICKGRKYFNTSTLLTLYYSFIYPYLTYCVEVWGNTSNCYLNSLSKLQKRAIRIITSANYRAHTDPLFNKLKILPLSKISDYSIIILMYKYARGMLPSVFNDMFIRNYEIHSYNTRQSTKIHVPKVKTAAYHNSFKYKGTLLWNFISDKINCNCSLAAYKHQLKLYLLKNNIIVK